MKKPSFLSRFFPRFAEAAGRKVAAKVEFTDDRVAKRNVFLLAFVVLSITQGAASLTGLRGWLSFLNYQSYDLIVRANEQIRRWGDPDQGAPERVAIVGIDDESLERYGRWPWKRSRMADLVRGLKTIGAKTVALDIVFSEPQDSPLDGLDALLGELPEEVRAAPVFDDVRKVGHLKERFAALPEAVQKTPVLEELRRRLLPPWEDQVFAAELRRSRNVVLGVTLFDELLRTGNPHWVEGLKTPTPPRNALELLCFQNADAAALREIRDQRLYEIEVEHDEAVATALRAEGDEAALARHREVSEARRLRRQKETEFRAKARRYQSLEECSSDLLGTWDSEQEAYVYEQTIGAVLQEAWEGDRFPELFFADAVLRPTVVIGAVGREEMPKRFQRLEEEHPGRVRADWQTAKWQGSPLVSNSLVDFELPTADTKALGLTLPLASLTMAAEGIGYMNDRPGVDNVARQMLLVRYFASAKAFVPSLTVAALSHFLAADPQIVLDEAAAVRGLRFNRREEMGRGSGTILEFETGPDLDVWINYYGTKTVRARLESPSGDDLGRALGGPLGDPRGPSPGTGEPPGRDDGKQSVEEREVSLMATVPAFEVLDALRDHDLDAQKAEREADWERLRKQLAGRLVFVGATASGLTDIRSTPLGKRLPGVEAHAAVAANMLEGRILKQRDRDTYVSLASTLLFLATLGFCMPRMRPFSAFVFYMALAGLAFCWSLVYFRHNLVIPPFAMFFPLSLYFMLGMAYLSWSENKQKAWLDSMFKRYVSPEYVEQIKANKGRLDLNGKEAVITPFFSDMAKFSTISESFSAEGLFRFLGEYLGEMADILDEHGGTLDKFEGDAVVAFFGAPIHYSDHAARACLASLHMQRRIHELEREWQTSDRYPELDVLAKRIGHWFPIRVRIGLNTGPCATGHLGTAERGNYTMMGDTVNLAARLEAAGKQYGITLTVSEDTVKAAGDVIVTRPVDVIQVVGRTVGTKIFEVVAPTSDVTPTQRKFLESYQSAWNFYLEREFSKASEQYTRALGLNPLDRVCEIFLERCAQFQAAPPPPDWDGVHILTEK